jgi:hypothetical protein
MCARAFAGLGGSPPAPPLARLSGAGPPTSGSSPYSNPSLLRQVSRLQDQVAQQAEQAEELHRELEERDAEGEELRQQLSLERFRYDLIVDLVRDGCIGPCVCVPHPALSPAHRLLSFFCSGP